MAGFSVAPVQVGIASLPFAGLVPFPLAGLVPFPLAALVPLPLAGAAPLPETIARLLGFTEPYPLAVQLVATFLGAFLVANILLVYAAIAGPWAKRKIRARFIDAIMVNRVGPFGLLIIIADAVRLISKELIVPEGVDRPAWDIAPILVPFSAILGFAVVPMGSGIHLADPETGLVFLFAASSITSIGFVTAGYASNNKYSLLGALRAIAGTLAYEIPLVITAASVVLYAGTLRPSELVAAQSATYATLAGISIPNWYALVNPLAFVVFVVAVMGEVARNPFDAAEAATEIVAGYQTEYPGVYFMLIYTGEFLHIFLGGGVIALLFLGGPAAPLPVLDVVPGFVWFSAKIWGFYLFTQWARAAVPRFRIDQFVSVGWKWLLVLAFGNLVLTATLVGVFTA